MKARGRLSRLAALALASVLLMAPTWPRDDSGVPAPVAVFTGSGGALTQTSTTDRFPVETGGPTQSTTDPTGFGKVFFIAGNPFSGDRLGAQPVFVTDQTVLAFTVQAGALPQPIRTYLSTNGGRTYALVSTTVTTFNVTGLRDAFRTTGGLLLLGGGGSGGTDGYLRSSDGVLWTQVDLPGVVNAEVNSIGQQGATVLISISNGGNLNVCRSTDSGSSFSSCSDPAALVLAANWANALASPSAGIWLVADGSGQVARSTDDGVTFTGVLAGLNIFSTVTCPSATVCLVADAGTIRRSTNAGATFTTVLSADPNVTRFRALLNFGSGVVVALSDTPSGGPPLYRSADFGATWGLASLLPGTTIPTGSAKANGGRAVVGGTNTGGAPQILYSPIVGAGETIIAGQSGNRLDIDPAGAALTRQKIVTTGLRPHTFPIQFGLIGTRTCSTPAVNTAATLTVTGVAGQNTVLNSFIAYYDVAPAAPTLLTVTDAGALVWRTPVAGANTPSRDHFGVPVLLSTAGTLVITLPAGGAAVSGTLCAVIGGPFAP